MVAVTLSGIPYRAPWLVHISLAPHYMRCMRWEDGREGERNREKERERKETRERSSKGTRIQVRRVYSLLPNLMSKLPRARVGEYLKAR